MSNEIELLSFRLNKNPEHDNYYAAKAIQNLIIAKKTIPDELLLWFEKICDVYIKQLSKTQKPSFETEIVRNRVKDVHLLRQYLTNRDEAIKLIAERDGIKKSAMLRNYNDSVYEPDKLEIEKIFDKVIEPSINNNVDADTQIPWEMFGLSVEPDFPGDSDMSEQSELFK